MKFKDNVTICWTVTNKWIAKCFEQAYREVLGKEPTCTGGSEGTHSRESGHYHNRALDFRHGLHWAKPLMTITQARSIQKLTLGRLMPLGNSSMGTYYIKIESDHFHVQRNKGEV